MKAEDKCREEFEEWMKSRGWKVFTRWGGRGGDSFESDIGNYASRDIQLAWEAWCASRNVNPTAG